MKIMLNGKGMSCPLGKHQEFQINPKDSLPSNHKHGQRANFGLVGAVLVRGDVKIGWQHLQPFANGCW